MRAHILVHRGPHSCCVRTERKGQESSLGLFDKGTHCIPEGCTLPSWPDSCPRLHPPHTVTLGVRFQNMRFAEIQTFSPLQSGKRVKYSALSLVFERTHREIVNCTEWDRMVWGEQGLRFQPMDLGSRYNRFLPVLSPWTQKLLWACLIFYVCKMGRIIFDLSGLL